MEKKHKVHLLISCNNTHRGYHLFKHNTCTHEHKVDKSGKAGKQADGEWERQRQGEGEWERVARETRRIKNVALNGDKEGKRDG